MGDSGRDNFVRYYCNLLRVHLEILKIGKFPPDHSSLALLDWLLLRNSLHFAYLPWFQGPYTHTLLEILLQLGAIMRAFLAKIALL